MYLKFKDSDHNKFVEVFEVVLRNGQIIEDCYTRRGPFIILAPYN